VIYLKIRIEKSKNLKNFYKLFSIYTN